MLWKCGKCGFILEGNEPPLICPVCGAPKKMYKKIKKADISTIDRVKNKMYRATVLRKKKYKPDF